MPDSGRRQGETELRASNHHPDPRTSRYGQRLVEEILGCRMSGWLTPKLECNKKLQVIPPPSHPPPEATWPVWSGRCPGAIPRGARFGRPGYEAKFALLHARILGRVRGWGGQLEKIRKMPKLSESRSDREYGREVAQMAPHIQPITARTARYRSGSARAPNGPW